MAVLLSTDVFSLIDDDLIVPFDTLADDDRGQGLAPQLLSGVSEERPDRRPYLGRAVPAFDHRAVLEQGRRSRMPGSIRSSRRRPGRNMPQFAAEADQARTAAAWTRWGVQIPGTGFTYWLFQALVDRGRRHAGQRRRHRDRFRQSRLRRGAALLDRPGEQVSRASAGHRRVGHHAARLPRAEGGDDLDHHGQPVEHPRQCEIPVRRGDAAGRQAARQPDRRRQFLSVQVRDASRSARPACASCAGSPARSAPRNGASTPAMSRPGRMPGTRRRCRNYVADFPAAAVARDQLQYAVAELSTHDNQRVTQALNDALQAALLGRKAPDAALDRSAGHRDAAAAPVPPVTKQQGEHP